MAIATPKPPIIGVFPYSSSENAYADRMTEIISHLGEVHSFPSPLQFVLNPFLVFRRRYDYLFLSWIDNIIVDRNGNWSIARTVALYLYLLACKIVTRKLVWIRHNNYPHHAKKNAIPYAKRILSHVEKISDIVITHSGHNAGGKRHYVPHPLYPDQVSEENPLAVRNYFLIFGRMLPYKNLEEAIRLAPSEVNLAIAGPAPDAAYLAQCQLAAEGRPNICILPSYLEAPEAAKIAKDSRGVIVLNADADMVVSGSYLFALGLCVPLYAVATPFLVWLCHEKKMAGIHAFDSIEALLGFLKNAPDGDKPSPEMIDAAFGDAVILRALHDAISAPEASVSSNMLRAGAGQLENVRTSKLANGKRTGEKAPESEGARED